LKSTSPISAAGWNGGGDGYPGGTFCDHERGNDNNDDGNNDNGNNDNDNDDEDDDENDDDDHDNNDNGNNHDNNDNDNNGNVEMQRRFASYICMDIR